MGDEPLGLGTVTGHPERVRYVFADQAALMVAMGKHSTEDLEAYRGQVNDFEAGAAQFVNFAMIALGTGVGDSAGDCVGSRLHQSGNKPA